MRTSLFIFFSLALILNNYSTTAEEIAQDLDEIEKEIKVSDFDLEKLENETITKDKSNIKHHIKWITKKTLFPIEMTHYINKDELYDVARKLKDNHLFDDYYKYSYKYDWYSYDKEDFVSRISSPQNNADFLATKSQSQAKLYIKNYDFETHDQLSSYEPRIVDIVPKKKYETLEKLSLLSFSNDISLKAKYIHDLNENLIRDIFTTVNLESHTIEIESEDNNLNVSCVGTFLVPFKHEMEDHFDDILLAMEKNSMFKLKFKPIKPLLNKIPSPFRGFNRLNSRFRQFDTPKGFMNNKMFEQQREQGLLRKGMNDLDDSNSANIFILNRNLKSEVNPNMFGAPTVMSSSTIILHRRKEKRSFNQPEVRNAQSHDEYENESLNEDESDLYEVRLVYGPIKMKKPINADELVTCTLNLIDGDHMSINYKSRVTAIVKAESSKDTEDQNDNINSSLMKQTPEVLKPAMSNDVNNTISETQEAINANSNMDKDVKEVKDIVVELFENLNKFNNKEEEKTMQNDESKLNPLKSHHLPFYIDSSGSSNLKQKDMVDAVKFEFSKSASCKVKLNFLTLFVFLIISKLNM